MPQFETVNSKVVKVTLGASVIARRGAMLGYTGDVRFVPHGVPGGAGPGGFGGMAGGLARRMAGEHEATMEATGHGDVWYGYRGSHVTVVDIAPGQTMLVEADRLLCHDSSLQSSTAFIGQGGMRAAVSGMVSGQGLFTTKLSGSGSAVILSHGETFSLPVGQGRQVAVDPQAYVAALGQVTVEVSAKLGWREAVGKGSGEAMQLRCTGNGTVFVQASEEKL